MKKTLLIAVFLLPIAWAKLASPQILPVPECWPCADDASSTLTVTNKILPVPECWPCADDNSRTLAVATPNILPVPECWPCADDFRATANLRRQS